MWRGQGTAQRSILSILCPSIECLNTTTYGTPMYIQTSDLIKVTGTRYRKKDHFVNTW